MKMKLYKAAMVVFFSVICMMTRAYTPTASFTSDGLKYICVLEWPYKVTLVGAEDNNITSLTIPETVYCPGWRGTTTAGSESYSYNVSPGYRSVTGLTASGFLNCTKLQSVIIKGSLFIDGGALPKSIHKLEFDSMSKLCACSAYKSVETLSNVDTIIVDGKMVQDFHLNSQNITAILRGCPAVKSVTFGPEVQTIASNAFKKCPNLVSVVLNDGLKIIYDSTFCECPMLKNVGFSSTLTTIGAAFLGCSELETLDFPASLSNVGEYAFKNCTSLKSVTFTGNSLLSLERSTFEDCVSLESVTLNEGLTTVGRYVFKGCSALKNVSLPQSLTTIGTWAFSECGLEEIVIPPAVASIDYGCFAECPELKKVTISEGVKTIGNSMFDRCKSLSSVSIPNTVTRIESCAFDMCSSLQSIDIPASVSYIGGAAFRECYSLEHVYLRNPKVNFGTKSPGIGSSVFDECNGLKVWGPIGSGANLQFACRTALPDYIARQVNISYLIIPLGLSSFCTQSDAFTLSNISTVYYEGSAAQWKILKDKNKSLIGNLYYAKSLCDYGKNMEAYYFSDDLCYKITDYVSKKACLCLAPNFSTYKDKVTIPDVVTIYGSAYSVASIADNILKSDVTGISYTGSRRQWELIDKGNGNTAIDNLYINMNVGIENFGGQTSSDALYINQSSPLSRGNASRLDIDMMNNCGMTGFQFEIELPTGISLQKDSNGVFCCDLNSERLSQDNAVLKVSELSYNRYLVLYASLDNFPVKGDGGRILSLPLAISESLESQDYYFVLRNIIMTDSRSNVQKIEKNGARIPLMDSSLGDANGDGGISVSDFTAIANHILGNTSASFVESAADVNQDGGITVSDLTGVANIILYGSPTGASLVAPMPEELKSNAVSEKKSSKGCIGGKQYIAQ